jgi:phosphate transport system substrate-binding protein
MIGGKIKKSGKLMIAALLSVVLITTIFSGCINSGGEEGLVIVVVGRDSASGTREFFWDHVLGKEDFVATMLEKNSNGAVHQTVSQTEGAIGFVGLGYVDAEVKALKIDTYNATVANVLTGDYPIARNLNMFTDGAPTGIILEYLNYIDSTEGQQIVEDEGFVPKTVAGDYTTVEDLSGTITVVGSTTVLPIAEKTAEEFNALYPDVTVTVTGGGSSVGVQSAGEGTADIGMASRELKSTEETSYPTLEKFIVCSDGIAIIVHPSNTYVDGLTLAQVKGIYQGTYTNWNEL